MYPERTNAAARNHLDALATAMNDWAWGRRGYDAVAKACVSAGVSFECRKMIDRIAAHEARDINETRSRISHCIGMTC